MESCGSSLRHRLAWLLALAAAGCSSTELPGTTGCDPACPNSSHCDDGGTCQPNPLPPDMAVEVDIAGTCIPACAGPTPYCNAAHHCVACESDLHCPVGYVCKVDLGACVPGCSDDSRCNKPDGGAAMSCCGGQCADTSSDVGNCGACGMRCMGAHSAALCAGGACQPGACSAGWGDCNKDPADGCETNLRVDKSNCTACGMACAIPNAVPACGDGCYIGACNFGYDDCNGDVQDGCETATLSDAKNCGGCGNACAGKPHAKASCVNAACQLSSCDPGWFDCNNDPADGCETATASDARNCGRCGNACAQGLVCVNGGCTCPNCNFPNAKSKCVNNMCQMDACLPGYADCNMDPKDGCEVNTNFDKNNCGACGNVCPMNMPGCNMGVCAMGCLNGMQPPPACTNDVDPGSGDNFTVCQSDCNGAWMAATKQGGGKYHIQAICQKYGYSKYGLFGGTCGNICGYCVGGTSCMNPQMNTKWDGGGMGCGMDNLGPILCFTVQWQCVR